MCWTLQLFPLLLLLLAYQCEASAFRNPPPARALPPPEVTHSSKYFFYFLFGKTSIQKCPDYVTSAAKSCLLEAVEHLVLLLNGEEDGGTEEMQVLII